MAKAKVTDEEVIELGYKLQKAKKNVNGHALSKVLGGRPDRLQEVWEKHLLEMNNEDNELQDIMLTPELNEIFDSISNDLLVNVKQLLASCEQAMLARTRKQIENERVANAERISALKEQLEDADIVINQHSDHIDSLVAEKQAYEERYRNVIELEKLLIELKAKLESCMSAIQDKERIINEQASRIEMLLSKINQ